VRDVSEASLRAQRERERARAGRTDGESEPDLVLAAPAVRLHERVELAAQEPALLGEGRRLCDGNGDVSERLVAAVGRRSADQVERGGAHHLDADGCDALVDAALVRVADGEGEQVRVGVGAVLGEGDVGQVGRVPRRLEDAHAQPARGRGRVRRCC